MNEHEHEPENTSQRDDDAIRGIVRDHYAEIARSGANGCCAPSCCAPTSADTDASLSLRIGYSAEEIAAVPEGADMGLGCGNPQAIAALKAGEVVVDLGSGGGFDSFLAARQVGPSGRVIGVDMTPDMVSKARANARKLGADNVEFRLGEIEHLPVGDGRVDVILSNCVINLSPDKAAVFHDAFRVLRPGGRLAISDVVSTAELPEALRSQALAHAACAAGAIGVDALTGLLEDAGFVDIRITLKPESREFIREWLPGSGAEDFIVSAIIEARRPGDAG